MPESLSFTAFILSLASTAAIHFGDLPDPMSGKPSEPDLDAAAQMIEILGLLDVKTRGNLTAEERQVLEQVLYELRHDPGQRHVARRASHRVRLRRMQVVGSERSPHTAVDSH